MMKSVGIITMHLPLSYGSALQTYALQKTIERLGYSAEIINYQYPNKIHLSSKSRGVKKIFNSIASFCINGFWGFPKVRKSKRFHAFHKHFYNLSEYYCSKEKLHALSPKYDFYCTGSDQVWNPLYTKGDTSFLLSFADAGAEKFSYAASFAIDDIPQEYKDFYAKFLSQYHHISVREKTGVDLVKRLTGKDASLVCDPTVLLTKEEWSAVADQSRISIRGPYLLVFMLRDSFDPYPDVQFAIDSIQKRLKCRIVYLEGGYRRYWDSNSKVINTAGPVEFLDLIRHAEYVITSSFHGTVFSSIFERPFTSIVKKSHRDSRILSYLERVGMKENALYYDAIDIPMSKQMATDKIAGFRQESISFLEACLR